MWDSIPLATQPSIGNERSHYVMPAPRHGSDVILYRSGSEPFLFASTRHNVSAGDEACRGGGGRCALGVSAHNVVNWCRPIRLVGARPDHHPERRVQHQHRVRSLCVCCTRKSNTPIATTITIATVLCRMGASICCPIQFSDPSRNKQGKPALTPALPSLLVTKSLLAGQKRSGSAIRSHSLLPRMVRMRSSRPPPLPSPAPTTSVLTGVEFDKVVSVMSCTNLSSTSRCSPRHRPSPSAAGGKNPGTLVVGECRPRTCPFVFDVATCCHVRTGPSYPQGMSVVAPAPEEHVGFYVVATNNKEDVWVAKVPYDSF